AVWLFRGQGSQRVGMGRDLGEAFPTARRVFEEADDRLGVALSRLAFEGPEDRLRQTEFAQPAILAASVAAYRVLVETAALAPVAVAGHSLGEWSALVAAGALDLSDALLGVRERGRLMQEAVPEGQGAMAAVVGLGGEAVGGLCTEAAQGGGLAPAKLTGEGPGVDAGLARAVRRLQELAKVRKARSQLLPVSAPFHCALMAPAAAGLERHLAAVTFRDPTVRVFTSVDARPIAGAGELRRLLVRQVTAPVRWAETMRALAGLGPTVALEVGPGRVLSGLLRRTVPALAAVPAGDLEGITRARELLA